MRRLLSLLAATGAALSMTGMASAAETANIWVRADGSNFMPQIVETRGFSAGINYGVDKVRFPSPVKVGQSIRAGAEMIEVSEVKGGIQTLVRITIEIQGGERPACVIDSISRWLH